MASPREALPIACVQSEHQGSLEATLAGVEAQVAQAADDGAEVVLLPEYFFLPLGGETPPPEPGSGAFDGVVPFLERVSRDHGIALAGTAPVREGGRVVNTCFVLERGKIVGVQEKIHPTPREQEMGVVGGTALATFELRGVPVGVAVCADILYPEVPRILSLLGAEVILVPVMSPYRGDDREDRTRAAREGVFVARAFDAGAHVLKAGGFAASHRVVGRSLVAAPWGLLARYRDPWGPEVLHAELDLAAARAHREGFLPMDRRAPWAYGPLTDPHLAPTTLPAPEDDPGDA